MTSLTFRSPLELEYLDGRLWRVTAPFVFDAAIGTIVVPAGFKTDFASIPRCLWALLPPTGLYGKAAVIHDYLYRTPARATRIEADAILLSAMRVLGTPWYIRWIIYLGVRLGGHWSYHGALLL